MPVDCEGRVERDCVEREGVELVTFERGLETVPGLMCEEEDMDTLPRPLVLRNSNG